ncbi:MAG: hypothetical protein ACKPKO_07995, partial [Candidatus Fonsibacter sp.]
MLGDVCAAAQNFVAQLHDDRSRTIPAIVLLDQSKEFERLPHPWLAVVLRRWAMPPWLIRGLVDQAADRTVRWGLLGASAPLKLLRRGVGLGGTASTLIWNIG